MAEPTLEDLFECIAARLRSEGRTCADVPGCWVWEVNSTWILAVNGHPGDPIECQPPGTMGCEVPSWHVAVWYNGWLAGLFAPNGGALAAHPDAEGASITTFHGAMRAALGSEGSGR